MGRSKIPDQSAFAFARALGKFISWRNSEEYNTQADTCLKRINVLAHSMGNRVLRETLDVWNRYDLPDGVPLLFRNTFLIAADIANESLQSGQRGELICAASRNVVVYFASDDLALRASKVSNLANKIASRRLGHTGPENMELTPRNVYSVDCDDINTLYDFPKGHSYFRSGETRGKAGLVFDHIFSTILSGRVFPEDEYRRTIIIKKINDREDKNMREQGCIAWIVFLLLTVAGCATPQAVKSLSSEQLKVQKESRKACGNIFN
jgi:hypothetical protein